jgi:putative DNA primase/helicase
LSRFAGRKRQYAVLDTIIGLRRPEDYEPQQGARFEVHVEKSRAHFGEAGRPFEASLVSTPDGRGIAWLACDPKPSHLEEAAALFRDGVTVRAVAAQPGIARSSAGRLRQKAQEDGLLDSDDDTDAGDSEDEGGMLH